jgi:hypothetical protein
MWLLANNPPLRGRRLQHSKMPRTREALDSMKSKLQIKFRMGLAGAALFAGVGGLLSIGAAAVQSTPAGATTAATTGDAYNAVTPLRITDTRAASGQENAGHSVGAGGVLTVSVPIADVGGSTTATAFTVNVTAVDATAPSYFTVYPTGDTSTNFSDLNFYPGFAQPNLVTTPVFYNSANSTYTFEIFNYAGTADAVVDLEGYYDSSMVHGQAYYPLTPVRITDTRSNSVPPQANAGKTIGADQILTIQVTGANGVPVGATAAVLNVTATNTTQPSYFTVYPGPNIPVASNVNWLTGETIPNRVTVQLSPSGTVSIFNYAGNADAVVDLDGYFGTPTAASPGNLFVPLAPSRITDTRSSSVPVQPNAGKTLTTGGTLITQVTGVGNVPSSTAGAPITAALLNVTAATATAGSYLTVYPASAAAPNASDLNFGPGFVVANNDPVGLSPTGAVNIFNYAGNSDVVVDVFGYYIPTLGATYALTLTPTSTAVAPGDTTTVTVTTTQGGLPAAATVAFVVAGSPAAACATAPADVTTSATGPTPGMTTFTYVAGTTDGNCFIAAEEGGPGYAQAFTSIQTSATVPSLTVTPASYSVVHGTTTTVTVTTKDAAGAPAAETVAFGVFGSVSGACAAAPPNQTTSATGATPGVTTFTYTAGTAAGTCFIGAEEGAPGYASTLIAIQTT